MTFALFKPSFSSNNDGHYFSPTDKSLRHFLLPLHFFEQRQEYIIFFVYLITISLFKSSTDKKPVDSIVRAQAVALSDARFSHVQISKQLNISRHCVQNTVKKYNEIGQYNDLQRTGC